MTITTGAEIVATFRQYEYVNYTWGGASPDTGWDCSGACNWICGFKYKLAIPGFGPGQYGPGAGHGPVVGDWLQWSGVARFPFGPNRPLPGDLVAWQPNVHMGMAIDGARFVSAANPNQGTIEADIGSFFSFAPIILRILQVLIRPSLPSVPPPPGPGPDDYSPVINRTAAHISGLGKAGYSTAVAIRNLRR